MLESQSSSSCSDLDLVSCEDERVQVLENGSIGLVYTNRGNDELSLKRFNLTSIGNENISSNCSYPERISRGETVYITCQASDDRVLVGNERASLNYEAEFYKTSLGEQSTVLSKGSARATVSSTPPLPEDYESEPTDTTTVLGEMQGDGTGSNPYVITNSQELQAMKEDISANYILGNNIPASGTSSWNGGNGFSTVGSSSPFTGSLDGQGYSVQGLHIDSSNERIGLFSQTDGATIQNLALTNLDITGQKSVGGLIGVSDNSVVQNIDANGDITGTGDNVGMVIGYSYNDVSDITVSGTVQGTNYIGGVVGVHRGNMNNAQATTTVTGSQAVGGITGYAYQAGTLSNIDYDGSVEATVEWAGGISGAHYGGNLENATISGSVVSANGAGGITSIFQGGYTESVKNTAAVTGQDFVGGLLGQLNTGSTLRDSVNHGDVDGDYAVAGIVGGNDGSIETSYSTGLITGNNNVGGLVGRNPSGTTSNSYWDTQSSSQTTSAGGTGLTTNQMQGTNAETNMTGFDFTNTWRTTSSYPELR